MFSLPSALGEFSTLPAASKNDLGGLGAGAFTMAACDIFFYEKVNRNDTLQTSTSSYPLHKSSSFVFLPKQQTIYESLSRGQVILAV